jgi:hypothetical protein
VKRGNHFDMTSGVRGHAPEQQEPPLSPVQHSLGRGGRGLLESAVFTEASGEKSEVSTDLFLPNLEKSGGGKKCNTLVPTYVLPGL